MEFDLKQDYMRWDKTGARPGGSGLLIELPTVTCERMEELFGRGAGMKMQRKEKYSKNVIIRLKPSNQAYALYMSYGHWRIGSCGTVITRIGSLLEQLDPVEYKGLNLLREDIVLAIAEKVNAGCTVGEAFDILTGVES